MNRVESIVTRKIEELTESGIKGLMELPKGAYTNVQCDCGDVVAGIRS